MNKLYLPTTLQTMGDYVLRNCISLEYIDISSKHEYYKFEDNILSTKQSYWLVSYLIANTQTDYTIPDYIQKIL